MKETYSSQYATACVLLDDQDTDPEAILEFAAEVGAVYSEDEPGDCVVLDWPMAGRSVGPELYTHEAVRRGCRAREASNG